MEEEGTDVVVVVAAADKGNDNINRDGTGACAAGNKFEFEERPSIYFEYPVRQSIQVDSTHWSMLLLQRQY